MIWNKIHKIEIGILLVFVGGVLFSFSFAQGTVAPDHLLHVYFFDVGQGDAMLVVTPNGARMLIDGGPAGGNVVGQLAKIIPSTDHRLDAVVATHTDADHLAGLIDALGRYKVSNIIETGMTCETVTCATWEKAAETEGAQRTFAYEGYRIMLEPELALTVLNPPTDVHGVKVSKTNNSAIVLRLDYGTQSILFTSDIEKTVEKRLIAQGLPLDVDFLKVGHHGSKTSSSPEFLDAVSPLDAFIEVGEHNSYGHPGQATLDELALRNIPWYRTDERGLIELTLDGTNYKINTHGK